MSIRLSSKQMRQWMGVLELNKSSFARLMGVTINTVRYWDLHGMPEKRSLELLHHLGDLSGYSVEELLEEEE